MLLVGIGRIIATFLEGMVVTAALLAGSLIVWFGRFIVLAVRVAWFLVIVGTWIIVVVIA